MLELGLAEGISSGPFKARLKRHDPSLFRGLDQTL